MVWGSGKHLGGEALVTVGVVETCRSHHPHPHQGSTTAGFGARILLDTLEYRQTNRSPMVRIAVQIVVGSVGGPRYGIDFDLEAASMLASGTRGVTIQKQVFGCLWAMQCLIIWSWGKP